MSTPSNSIQQSKFGRHVNSIVKLVPKLQLRPAAKWISLEPNTSRDHGTKNESNDEISPSLPLSSRLMTYKQRSETPFSEMPDTEESRDLKSAYSLTNLKRIKFSHSISPKKRRSKGQTQEPSSSTIINTATPVKPLKPSETTTNFKPIVLRLPTVTPISIQIKLTPESLKKKPMTSSLTTRSPTKKAFSPPKVKEKPIFRNLIFTPNVNEDQFYKHLMGVHRGLIYSVNSLKGPSPIYLESRKVMLENIGTSNLQKKTLILDLDETLVMSCKTGEIPDAVASSETTKVAFKIRPYAKSFLVNMSRYFEMVAFTSGTEVYAQMVVNELDPSRDLICYILDRRHCLKTISGYYIKDLRIIRNRKLKDIVIVDNLVHSFGLQLENGIPILEWRGEKEDTELKYLQPFLIELSKCDDVTTFLRERLKLMELSKIKTEDVNELFAKALLSGGL